MGHLRSNIVIIIVVTFALTFGILITIILLIILYCSPSCYIAELTLCSSGSSDNHKVQETRKRVHNEDRLFSTSFMSSENDWRCR